MPAIDSTLPTKMTVLATGGRANRTIDVTFEEVETGESQLETEALHVGIARSFDGDVVVLAAAEAETVTNAIGPLLRLFAIALPLTALGVGVLAWNTTARALAPVEAIRRETTTITGRDLSGRVPMPDGEDEIRELAYTMNEMLDRLQTHQHALRRFTSDASHELTSPVANIRMLSETASIDDHAWPAVRRQIVGETGRLEDLVENLLFLATRDEGVAPPPATVVHLDDLLFDEAHTISARGTVSVDIGGVEPATVHGERSDLRRLTRNLVDNAVRHATTTVWLSTTNSFDEKRGAVVSLMVSDDGAGVPDEQKDAIFERFARLGTARDRTSGGTGLGLAIARQIAQHHGGSLSAHDRPGGGTTMRADFPHP